MRNKTSSKTVLGLLIGVQLFAGVAAHAATAFDNNGDWQTWIQNKPGTLYRNKENPYFQELTFVGRYQYQVAYVDGSDVNGNDFNETYDEHRRARLGVKVKFLKYFGAFYQVNLVDDGRRKGGELDWGYKNIDEAYLSFDLGQALGDNYFDEFSLNYGRQKFLLAYETHTSSKKLLTGERSALANKVYGSARPTGLQLEAAKGDWSSTTALYSSSIDGDDNEAFNGWNDGEIFLLNLGYKVSDSFSLGADYVYNNADANQDDLLGYESAFSINGEYSSGDFGVIADLIYGDNGDNARVTRRGDFYGVMVMPYYWIMDEKLQGVAQFEHMAASDSEGVRINSRYGRSGKAGAAVNGGRGDSHQSIYTGLNYYLAGHNVKFQGGIEYQQMDTPTGDLDTFTFFLAFRSFF